MDIARCSTVLSIVPQQLFSAELVPASSERICFTFELSGTVLRNNITVVAYLLTLISLHSSLCKTHQQFT